MDPVPTHGQGNGIHVKRVDSSLEELLECMLL